MTTIKEWCDGKTQLSNAKRWLREAFPKEVKRFGSGDTKLSSDEIRALDAGFERHKLGLQDGAPAIPATVIQAPPDPLLDLDIRRPVDDARASNRVERLYLHDDFITWLDSAPPDQRAACLRALENIAAYGRPSRVKGVKGINAGWLRTPTGGTNGMQFYLWYADRGSNPIDDKLEHGEYLIRAVRHHDATSFRIEAGARDEWLPWSPRDLIDELDKASEVPPLSPAQRRAIEHGAPIQLIRGSPGAGKTTALLHGVRRLSGRVLYLTFGAALVERARRWFDSLVEGAPTVMTFSALIESFVGRSVPPDPNPRESSDLLRSALATQIAQLGPWRAGDGLDAYALYVELHAHVVGRGRRSNDDEQAYLSARVPIIGEGAARCAWSIARSLDDGTRARLFPGPLAALEASEALSRNSLPAALADVDWIVVDETQDLTMVELEVVVGLARAIAVKRGIRPGIRFAGDEGQTLRPTGFAWSEVKRLLQERLGVPEESVLESNVRSTREVASLVQRVTDETYRRLLPKERRPRGQGRVDIDPVEGGEVLLVRASIESVDKLMLALASCGAIVEPGRVPSMELEAAARRAQVRYLSSETAKGLDFDSVAVIDLGRSLARLRDLAVDGATNKRSYEMARSLADHARVAVSRAVNRVVLVEIAYNDGRDDGAAKAIKELFAGEAGAQYDDDGQPEPLEISELAGRLEADTGDAVARLVEALSQGESLLDKAPEVALRFADDAHVALVRAGRARAVGEGLRNEVFVLRGRARIAVACTLAASKHREDLLAGGQESLRQGKDGASADVVAGLRRAQSARTVTALGKALAERAGALALSSDVGRRVVPLFDQAIDGIVQAIVNDGEMKPAAATDLLSLLDQAEAVLPLTAGEEARTRALMVLAKQRNEANAVLDRIAGLESGDMLAVRAQAFETLGYDDAPTAWVAAGDALRGLTCLRDRGDLVAAVEFARAHRLGTSPALATARSLLAAIDEAAPLLPELTNAEREALSERIAAIFPIRRRK